MYTLTSLEPEIFAEYNLTPSTYVDVGVTVYFCEITPALYTLLVLKYTPRTLSEGLFVTNGLYFRTYALSMEYRRKDSYEKEKAHLEKQCTS